MLIAWDKASKEGDYSCKVYGKIDKEGNWHIKKVKCYRFKPIKKVKKMVDYKMANRILDKYKEGIKRWLEIYNKKEVKKMKYFETEVVKVKKVKKSADLYIKTQELFGKMYGYYMDKNNKLCLEEIKDNWVNGENLDKIKFPCFCRFDPRRGIFGGKQGVHGIGIINRTAEGGKIQYQLSWGDRQMENSGRLDILANLSVLCTTPSLKRLIELYDIKIRKGKIIIYEEK